MIDADTLLAWYRQGVFPMADGADGDIELHRPLLRGIIDPATAHLPDSLRRSAASPRWTVTVDRRFEEVMERCADREETWISREIIDSYVNLHRLGRAHSVEAWRDGALAGGLYGVALGGAFFGESMFHTLRDGSKVALAWLLSRMRERGMTLLDTQYVTPHLERFGAFQVTHMEYLRRLRAALALDVTFAD
jgi:leucyl/phenylalanyl-tRNA--protein transferase